MKISSVKQYNFQARTKRGETTAQKGPKKKKAVYSDEALHLIYQAQKQGIYSIENLEKELGIKRAEWYREKCFNSTSIVINPERKKSIPAIDINDELNAKNLDIIRNRPKTSVTKNQLIKNYSVTLSDLTYLTNIGLLKPVLLTAKDSKPQQTSIIDMADHENARAFERLIRKRSDLNKKLIQASAAPVNASIYELSSLGCGTPKRLYEAVEKGYLKGRLTKSKAGADAVIDLNNSNNQDILRRMRAGRTLDEKAAENVYGISRADFYRAIYDGRLEPLDALFIGDMEKLAIDLGNAANRKNFHNLIITSLGRFKAANGANVSHNSLIAEIIAELYPELTESALEIADNNKDLQNAISKKMQFEKTCEKSVRIDESADDADDEEAQNQMIASLRLTKHENELINEFDRKLLSTIDYDKFRYALKEALIAQRQYKTSGKSA
ncbi:hypothetical protein IJ531_02190, partial [bacterium]|nr:hypothetical protein [bacterium]